MSRTVGDLAAMIHGKVVGDASLVITGMAALDGDIAADQLVWVESEEQLAIAEQTAAACVLVPTTVTTSSKPLICVPHPKLAFARLLQIMYPPAVPSVGIHPSSVLASDVQLGADVSIGPHVVIGAGVSIRDRSTVGAGTVIGDGCVIGADVYIAAHVTLYHDITIGDRVRMHSGSVIGAAGFGYVMDPETKQYVTVPQIGTVVIENDVDIGALVAIDRATMGQTIIRRGTKIDNHVQIAHNVSIGEDTIISANSGIAGSSVVGDRCMLGGDTGIADHVTLEDDVMLGGGTALYPHKVVRQGTMLWGRPPVPMKDAPRVMAAYRNLHKLVDRIRALEKQRAVQDESASPDAAS